MASQQELIQGQLLERTKIVNFAYNAHAAMQIQYVGPKLYSTITVAAGGDITIYADDTDGATTSYFTADLSTPAAARDTFGELAAEINADPYLRCFLIGEIPSASTDNRLAAVTNGNIATANGLTLLGDPAVSGYIVGFAVTNEKFTSRPTGGHATKSVGWVKNDNCVNSLCYLNFTLTTVGDGTYQVYSVDGTTVNTLIPATAFSTATLKEVGVSPTPDTVYVAAARGERLVVTMDGAAAITAGNVYAIGKTKHLFGQVVPASNYTGSV